ncbi:PepSY-associated TM helix domain-containing protein [Piscinibacter sakaiensis]|uniref:Uncharacterized iron-regulated membrane protein n=1 Tax=Piscinibacter sakaiensis TaxID=1547922 RepID=A0A0K8NYL1_PISS1|nr:PepSY domain-containing protein [Piscinibacter sakaiensis]GAP35010.1 uncharacterized iron-regulated membrane protein [Piscinibacter sakaiensis]
MAAPAPVAPGDSALFRRVWRWHFYAGLVCLPFLVLLAVTGGLYLFKEPIEALLYAPLREVAPPRAGVLDAQTLVALALAAEPGDAVRYVAPAAPGRSAEVGVRTAGAGVVAVYLDPADGRVLGRLPDAQRLMELVKRLHSLAIAGAVANHLVEVVAGWAIVLVLSGVFLWWPRGRPGSVLRVQGRPAQRRWWRDLHALTGSVAAVAILFLAVTGLPWSAFWGERFGQLSAAWGLGVAPYVWGPPPPSSSAPPLAGLTAVPWALGQVPVPVSSAPAAGAGGAAAGGHAGHAGDAGSGVDAPAPATTSTAPRPAFGLNDALERIAAAGLPAGTPVRLPAGPRGAYSALHFPDDVRGIRVLHLDRHTGAVLADVGYADYGALGRATEWGISLHTGRQFGAANQAVMLAACVSIVMLAVSAAVMWWKRRPAGRLAAPPRRAGDRAAAGAIAVAVLLGGLYPLLGASMLLALAVDALVPARWRERLGL